MAVTQVSSARSDAGETIHVRKDGAALTIALGTASYTLIASGVKAISVMWLPTFRWLVLFITGTDTLNARQSLNASPQSASDWETVTP